MTIEMYYIHLLDKYNINIPKHKIVHSLNEALKASNEIGYPVVLKILSHQIAHKSKENLVRLSVYNDEECTKHYEDMIQIIDLKFPKAIIHGISVEQMIPRGIELFIGGKIDNNFGRVITVGSGGTFVEIYNDTYTGLITNDKNLILDYFQRTKIYNALIKYGINIDCYITAVQNAVTMFEQEDLSIFDINPFVILDDNTCYALDFYVDNSQNGNIVSISAKRRDFIPHEYYHPQTIAMIGASNTTNKMGYIIFKNLIKYSGNVIPVNNHSDEVQGVKAYHNIIDIQEQIDMVIIGVHSNEVLPVLKDCGKKGIKLAIIVTAGFRESQNDSGIDMEKELIKTTHKYNIRVIGPNCLGVIIPRYNLNTTYISTPRRGNICIISQSGSVTSAIVNEFGKIPTLGCSFVASIGNQCDIDIIDCLEYGINDDDTHIILLYVEAIKNGKEFVEYCKSKNISKPIIVIKAGHSNASSHMSMAHTGTLSGAYEIYMAVFNSLKFKLVNSIHEALLTILGYALHIHDNVIVLTNSGSAGIILNDCAQHIPNVPIDLITSLKNANIHFIYNTNFIDLIGDANIDRLKTVLQILNNRNDTLIYIGFVNPLLTSNDIKELLLEYGKTTIMCLLGDKDDKILFQDNMIVVHNIEDVATILNTNL